MNRFFCCLIIALSFSMFQKTNAAEGHEYYEIRSYILGENGDPAAIDAYLESALIPALDRAGIGPVGVFSNSPADETGSQRIIVVIPYEKSEQISTVKKLLQADQEYLKAAEGYLGRGPRQSPFQRIESELLVSMDCMPKLEVNSDSLKNQERVYELRIYESANERLGDLKVEMFNSGEVPIFLDCGIQPVFIGQALVGPFTPSLTYLTVYPSEEKRGQAWQDFRVHPDWQVLKEVEKFKGTVSKIYKYVLSPKSYSGM
ncbi:MAG: NIPSNAP family protein [Rubripirellula sp.]|nr:NIPSNAP family protein [Rubripirellula sp.]